VSGFDFGLAGFRFWRKHELGRKLVRRLAPKFAERRARKRARQKAEKDAAGGEFFPDETEETSMFNGMRTYIGIATAAVGVVLGWLGVGQAESSELAGQIVGALDQVLTVAGLALAAYGRAKAQPK